MKVLHLIDSGGLYGAEQMLLALAGQQLKNGLKPIILSCGLPDEQEKAIEAQAKQYNIEVVQWRMSSGLNFLGAAKILRYAKKNHIDVLHSHGYKFNILFAFFPKFIRRIPFITTVHGYVFAKKYSAMWLYQWLDKIALKVADIICLVSPSMKAILPFSKIAPAKIKVIPNGIAVDKTPQKSFASHEASTLKLLAIGRLVHEKNFSLLIEAVALAVKKGLNISLTIMGDGPLKVAHQQQIEALNLTGVVSLAGFVRQPAQYFDSFDTLVMSSTTEGLPITLLEAMRDKLPIIATAVGGIPFLLENSDYLVPSNQLNDLSEAIIKMANHSPSKRAEIALDNQKRFFMSYTAEIMKNSYSAVYQEVLG